MPGLFLCSHFLALSAFSRASFGLQAVQLPPVSVNYSEVCTRSPCGGYSPFEFCENLRGTPRPLSCLQLVEILPPPPPLPVIGCGSFFRCRFCAISADKGKTIRTTLWGSAIIRKGKRVRKFKRGLLLCGFHSTGNARPCQTGAGLRVLRLIKTYTVCALCGKQAGFSPLSEIRKKPVFARGFGCFVRFSTGRKCSLCVIVFSGWVCNCFFGCV